MTTLAERKKIAEWVLETKYEVASIKHKKRLRPYLTHGKTNNCHQKNV
jgi:hypothetical protein